MEPQHAAVVQASDCNTVHCYCDAVLYFVHKMAVFINSGYHKSQYKSAEAEGTCILEAELFPTV